MVVPKATHDNGSVPLGDGVCLDSQSLRSDRPPCSSTTASPDPWSPYSRWMDPTLREVTSAQSLVGVGVCAGPLSAGTNPLRQLGAIAIDPR